MAALNATRAGDAIGARARQLGTCSQRHRRVEVVEAKIIEHYATIQLTPARREQLRHDIQGRFSSLIAFSATELDRAKLELDRLMDEERKLLRAHYQDKISEALFAEEEVRIRTERVAAQSTVEKLSGEYDLALSNLDKALALTEHIQAAYDLAPGHVRRMFNQAFFEKLLIIGEDELESVLNEPWDTLLDAELATALRRTTCRSGSCQGLRGNSSESASDGTNEPPDQKGPRVRLRQVWWAILGSNQ